MKMNRRRMLTTLGASAALSATFSLRGLATKARAQVPARVLFVYVPDGCIPSRWHPTGSERSFVLPDMTAPLERVRDQCIFLDGLTMYAGGPTHEGGYDKILTGDSDESIDFTLGRALGADVPFEVVQLGVGTTFQNNRTSAFSHLAGAHVLPEDNPGSAFTNLFGGGIDDQGAALRQAQRQRVLDTIAGDTMAMRGRLGATERTRLDTVLEAIGQVERRLTNNQAATCTTAALGIDPAAWIPDGHYPPIHHRTDTFSAVGDHQMDLAALSLACGLTRVISLTWSHQVSPTVLTDTTSPMGNHDASHYGNPTDQTANHFVAMKRWFMERFAALLDRLAAFPEGDGTLLDHTIVMLSSELGDANQHDHNRVPFVLAGGSALGFDTGRFLDYRGSHSGENAPHTKMLVSIARRAGHMIDRFGYDGHGTGPLEGL